MLADTWHHVQVQEMSRYFSKPMQMHFKCHQADWYEYGVSSVQGLLHVSGFLFCPENMVNASDSWLTWMPTWREAEMTPELQAWTGTEARSPVCSPAAQSSPHGCLSSPPVPWGSKGLALTSTAPESPLTHSPPKFWGFPLRAAPCLQVLPFPSSWRAPISTLEGQGFFPGWGGGLGAGAAHPRRDF